ncbi:MAG: efflux RND transporter periplasmic adaptor subunit [Thermoanaerobaculia bacterium]
MKLRTGIGLALAALALNACTAAPASTHGSSGSPARAAEVRRGDFVDVFVLTGALEATRGETLSVPTIPMWQTTIKWLIDDGSRVKTGDRIAELDSTALTSNLEQQKLTAAQARQRLAQNRASSEAQLSDSDLTVEQRKLEMEKAAITASVPKDLLPLREYSDRQLALQRARSEYEKAVTSREALRKSSASEIANLLLDLEKTEREIAEAESAVHALTLRAPVDGVVVIENHPWEGRPVQVGDSAWVGMSIATIPDLSTIQVLAQLSDVDDGKVLEGMPVEVKLDAYPGAVFRGHVSRVSSIAQEPDPRSRRRSFRVSVALDHLDQQKMRPGFSALVLVRRAVVKNVLLVPRAAVDFSRNQTMVRVRDRGPVEARLGACNPQECVVEAGLTEGTLVDVSGGRA